MLALVSGFVSRSFGFAGAIGLFIHFRGQLRGILDELVKMASKVNLK